MTEITYLQIARRRAGIWLPALLLLLVAACSDTDSDPTATPTEAALQSIATPTVAMTATAPPTATTPESPTATVETLDPEPGAPDLDDPYFPNAGNGGYDVHHYHLDLRYDPEIDRLEGTATITAAALHDLASFNLDFMGMELAAVSINGVDAGYERDGQELRIIPPEPLGEGSEFEVIIVYGGFPEPIGSVFGDRVGWNETEDGAFVLSEPNGSPSWYPVNDHPLDKASYTFEITVPDGLEVAANGLLVEQSTEGGWTTWVYDASNPMASYLTTVNIGDFVFEDGGEAGGVPIRNVFDASFGADARQPFERTSEMMTLFESLFGPYPFEVYGVAVLDFDWGGVALETQTLSIFDRNYAEANRYREATAAHELAHQWFGNSVSPASWQDIWLNEGFATYSQLIWIEEADDISVGQQIRSIYEQSGARFTEPPPGDPGAEQMFAGSVYYRGAFTLHALRLTIGDDLFFETLRTYLDRYAGGNASTQDFITVAEDVSGEDLDALFDAWLYAEELPALPD